MDGIEVTDPFVRLALLEVDVENKGVFELDVDAAGGVAASIILETAEVPFSDLSGSGNFARVSVAPAVNFGILQKKREIKIKSIRHEHKFQLTTT